MINFEDRLRASAQRLASEENKKMHLLSNPLGQKPSYWGWVATPAAAVAGIVLGMSLDAFVGDKPSVRFVQTTDTVEVVRPVHDTLYLTQVVEKERIVERPVYVRQTVDTIEQEDTLACTSIQCDGINYALLTLK